MPRPNLAAHVDVIHHRFGARISRQRLELGADFATQVVLVLLGIAVGVGLGANLRFAISQRFRRRHSATSTMFRSKSDYIL
jgi:hypothetical protein